MPGLEFPRVEPVDKQNQDQQQQRFRRSCNRRRRRRGENREVEIPNSIILFSSNNHTNNNTATNSFFVSSGNRLFSSASAAGSVVDRCSFGSDHDGLLSQLPLIQHLAGHDRGCKGPDPEKRSPCEITPLHKFEEEAVQEVVGYENEGGGEETLDPAKHSFSLALRECQNRRFGSEAFPSPAEIKNRRRRPASLDLNSQGSDASLSSPRFFVARGSMKKSSAVSSRGRSGTFPSPGTPNYKHGGGPVVYNKGWSSERVPLPVNYSRRYGSSAALLPFTNNGRTLPSKWEDAEKWIFSPVSGDGGIGKPSVPPPHHRRPKSKSGPLGAPIGASGSYSAASPLVPVFDGGRVRNFTVSSPFQAGDLLADLGCHGSGSSSRGACSEEEGRGGGRSASANTDPCIVRSASVHSWAELMIESSSSLPSSHDDKLDITRDAATMISPGLLRKDMATQMSPEGSTHSSPKERPYYSSPPSTHTIGELQNHLCKLEVRDVQVDDRVTVTRWSKKHIVRGMDKGLGNIIEWKKKTVEAKSCAWEVSETAKCVSKFTREEAKITAWENLQKAKAEAAMRKLEMKLEKKRSSSMNKILNKLKSAQRKAQEMRHAVNASQGHQVATTPKNVLSFRRTAQIGSLSGCFTCHAF